MFQVSVPAEVPGTLNVEKTSTYRERWADLDFYQDKKLNKVLFYPFKNRQTQYLPY